MQRTQRKSLFPVVGLVILSVITCSPAFAGTIGVSAQSNPFLAGLGTAGNPAGGDWGVYPVSVPVSAGNVLTITATGEWYYWFNPFGAQQPVAPDGMSVTSPPGTNVNPYAANGVSGMDYTGRVFFLVGVFGPTTPGAPPATLSYTNDNFTFVSPDLGQLFLIGDGRRTDTNALHYFTAPTGATQLYLGVVDAQAFTGDFGTYNDNSGSLSVTYLTIPEPGTAALIVGGLALCWLGSKRKKFFRP